MAHVLIATDMSAHALNAAIYGIRLYGTEGNSFTLLNTYQSPPSPADMPVLPDLAAQLSIEGLEAFAKQLLEHLPQPTPDLATVSAYGPLGQVLQDLCEGPEPPDLVVMGTHGASGLERLLMGSTTASVIRSSALPVLAVPAAAQYQDPKRIILADDGGAVERSTLKVLLDIARWSRSEVVIVHVVPEGHEADETFGSSYDVQLGAIPHTFHSVIGDNVMLALNDLANQRDTDLAVVVHRHRGLVEQLFHRSVATDLALHTHVPLLVLQQAKD